MTDFTRSGNTRLPSAISEIGGIVFDIIGANGNRLVLQIPATQLARVPAGATAVDLASVTLTAEQYAALGGGIQEFDVRVTAFDGDSEAQNADGTIVNGFRFNGGLNGDVSDNRTETTSADGLTVLAEREGFGDGTLDTSWMRFSGNAATQFYNGIDPATRTITITYIDYNGAQDEIDWAAGLDAARAASGLAPTFVPTATSTGASSDEGSPATITVAATDPLDGRPLSYAFDLNDDGIIEQRGSSNSFTFTPADEGSYRVRYYVTDADGLDVTRSRTFTIGNAAPTANDDAARAAEGASITIDALANDTDPGADRLTITGARVVAGGGSVAVVDGRLVFSTGSDFDDLGAGESRVVTLAYGISDGDGGTDEAEVSITVTGANDAPTAAPDTGALAQDGAVTVAVTANDTDPDGDALAVTAATVRGGRGVASFSGGSITFTTGDAFDGLGAGETETVVVDYTVGDGNGGSATSTLTLSVTGTNDGPVASADAGALAQDGAVTVGVAANDFDADGDALAVTAAGVRGGRGAVSFSGGAITFTAGDAFDALGAGKTETVIVDYSVGDGNGGTAASTLTLTVTGANDGPVAVADAGAVTEDGTARIEALANDRDVDGDPLNIASAAVRGGRGAVTIDGGALLFATAGAFESLAAGRTEAVVIDYTIGDGNGGTSSSTATVTVTGVNDAPVAADEAAAVAENGRVTIHALANDRDVDAGDALSLANLRVTGGGSASIVDGRIVYDAGTAFDRLRAGETATVTIDYDAVDAAGARDAGRANVTVTGVNDAPVAVDDVGTVRADGALTLDVLSNDRDVDGGALSLTGAQIVGDAAGRVSVVNGKLVFDTAGAFANLEPGQSATVRITYTLSDGQGGADEGTAVVSVTGFDRPDRTLNGTNQSDYLVGGDGFDDTIRGLAGHDWLEGGAGNDRLFGEAGHDALFGGAGRDVLDGGHSSDLLVGGDGADRFVMGRGYGRDVVLDFKVGEDRVVLDGVRLDRTQVFDVDGDGRADTVLDLSHGSQLILLGVDQPVPASVLFG